MAQVKIYAFKKHLDAVKNNLSNAIHKTIVDTLKLPEEKKFQRFMSFEKDMIIFPKDKTDAYTIIEIMMIKGRSKEIKKELINNLFINIKSQCNIDHNDIEIVIIESEAYNWGFRGKCGDEIELNYKITI